MRLNQHKRAEILNHARANITCPDEEAAELAAHAATVEIIVAAHKRLVSQADLEVLRRYGYTEKVAALTVLTKTDEGQTESLSFCLCPRDVRQQLINQHGCHRQKKLSLKNAAAVLEVPIGNRTTIWGHYEDRVTGWHGRGRRDLLGGQGLRGGEDGP